MGWHLAEHLRRSSKRDIATSTNININEHRPLYKQMGVGWQTGRQGGNIDGGRERHTQRDREIDENPQRVTDQRSYNASPLQSR